MPTDAIVQDLRRRLPDDFHRSLLDGSVQVLAQADNPVRAHLFAAGLRELFGLSLETLAPDDKVRSCVWYEQSSETGQPTRRQRAIYATRGGLSDDFIRRELQLDPEAAHQGLGRSFEELNKRTHVRPKTVMVDPAEIDAFAESAIDALRGVFVSVEEFRKELTDRVEAHIQREAILTLIQETIGTLDQLASHHSIESIYVDWTRVTDLDNELIQYEAGGSVDVTLQWGSSADMRNDEGATLDENFPFRFTTAAFVEQPYAFVGDLSDVQVDTSKWHEN